MSNRTAVSAEQNPYEVLQNRNFLFFLAGRFIASFGQQMVSVAVGWELYERTHSALALGLVGLTQMIPMFAFTLPAGHVADNHDRKKVILLMIAIMAAASFGLALSSWHQSPVGWMYFWLFVSGAARTFVWPTSAAWLPQLVPRRIFSRAVTWNTSAFHLSSVIGPAAGGGLIALANSAGIVYLLNAIASLICVGLFAFIRVQYKSGPREPLSLQSLSAGFKFVFANPVILGIITLDMFAVLLGGAVSLLPIYAKDILHEGPSGLGILQAALPVGSLICAMIMAHIPPVKKAGRTLLYSVAGFGVATILFGVSRNFLFSFLMLFACGMTDNVSVVIRNTLVQLLTPDEKRGRVSAVNSLFIGTSNELGGFESGIVAQYFGPVFSVVTGGIGTILVVIAVAKVWPQIRNYGRLDAPTDATS
ncbi:MAG: MFS transporter [Verrucomicrobiota bacterium]